MYKMIRISIISVVVLLYAFASYAYDSTKQFIWLDPSFSGSYSCAFNPGDFDYVFNDINGKTNVVKFINEGNIFRQIGLQGQTSNIYYVQYTQSVRYSYFNVFQSPSFVPGQWVVSNPDYVDIRDKEVVIQLKIVVGFLAFIAGLISALIFAVKYRL